MFRRLNESSAPAFTFFRGLTMKISGFRTKCIFLPCFSKENKSMKISTSKETLSNPMSNNCIYTMHGIYEADGLMGIG